MDSIPISQALAKRSFDTALMPPPPRPKRIKRPQKVLDEDTYTSALSQIIARDFFPGLVETESQQEYLDALDSQDEVWIASAGRKLTEVMAPGPDGRRVRGRRGTSMTPMIGRGGETPKGWGGETPMSVAGSEMSSTTTATDREGEEVDTNMSLSAFQTKYTSEDNESFYKLLDKQNLKRAEKYAWMWAGNKIPSARQIAQHQRSERLLTSKATQDSPEGGNQQQLTISTPDSRKAMPDSWNSKPDNQFMFGPDSIEDSTQTVQQSAEETSRAPPKAVIYDNTRLPPPPPNTTDSDIPPSPSLSAIQDALSGRPRPTDSEPGFSGAETPRVNGYAFVDATPSPTPSSPSTWGGSLDGSYQHHQLLLGSAGDGTPNPFKIKAQSKREDLHHRMVERVARNNRVAKREAEVKTPVPRFASSPRVVGTGGAGLTPAGRRLWSRVGSPASGGGAKGGLALGDFEKGRETGKGVGMGMGMGSSLRHRWTPTPRAQMTGE
ncbi:MAG: hypothetical protein M1830_002791 [Pleopsidium flavum]|nr:MAG: hypothetical protein M1830_002791 [Pleopsidium flavum]